MEAKDAEIKAVLDREEKAIEAMTQKMKDQEKAKQSEVIKMQMEVFQSEVSAVQVLWCWVIVSLSKPLLIAQFSIIPTWIKSSDNCPALFHL